MEEGLGLGQSAKPDSPHLLAPKIKARLYFAIASDDDMRQPDAKDKLKEAFAAAKIPAETLTRLGKRVALYKVALT